jgi:transposase-like protein
MSKAAEPTTLQEAFANFSNQDNCHEYVVPRRWASGVICPTCGSDKVTFQPKHNRWQCSSRHPRRQFTLKTGTVMEDSALGLDKWLPAMWLVASNRNGISSWELHRALGVTQKTAWFMLHRIRLAMQDETKGGKIGGPGAEVEVDETFIGGRARNMHKQDRIRKMQGKRGGPDSGNKTVVLGMLGGKILHASRWCASPPLISGPRGWAFSSSLARRRAFLNWEVAVEESPVTRPDHSMVGRNRR